MKVESQSCALCCLPKPLQESHIFPEFLYRHVYSGEGKGHRFIVIPSHPKDNVSLEQSGLKEKLLCWDCEQKIGQWDNYASQLLHGGTGFWAENKPGRIVCTGVEYAKFKLFQMSLIWRAGVSRQAAFIGTSLGHHTERLRSMIYASDPGKPHDYPCLFILQPDLFSTLKGCMWAPMQGKAGGHTVYVALAGGLFWFFIVSSHSRMYPEVQHAIDSFGKMSILVGNKDTSAQIQAQLVEAVSWAKEKRNAKHLPKWGFE